MISKLNNLFVRYLLFPIAAVMFVVVVANAQKNYTGYRDTVLVADFNADSAGVTRAFELSQYEAMRLYALADDTSSDGYASDSVLFKWGIQIGNVMINTSNVKDTTWGERVLIDTFDIATADNLVEQELSIDTIYGSTHQLRLFIDTINVSGFAVQDRFVPMPNWGPVFRFYYAGLTGNKIESYIALVFGQSRRTYTNVRGQ